MANTGAANAIVGDLDEPTKLPQTEVPKEQLTDELKLAKYSKTAEFQRLKEFMEDRILFYQHYLPSGVKVEGDPKKDGFQINLPNGDLTAHWIAACVIIKEFESIIGSYEYAAEAVEQNAER